MVALGNLRGWSKDCRSWRAFCVSPYINTQEGRRWRIMNTLKSIGGTLLGIAIFIGIIVATVLFFTLGAKVAFTIAPFINWLAGILFAINLLLLFFAIIPKARGIVGLIIYISSYVYGLSAWIYGLAVTLALWGWIAVIIGLFRRRRCCSDWYAGGNIQWSLGYILDIIAYSSSDVRCKNNWLCVSK